MDLTSDQVKAVQNGEAVPITLNQTECIVLRKDVYQQVANLLSVSCSMSDEERARIGWEAGKSIGWDTPEMAQYDDYDAYRQ